MTAETTLSERLMETTDGQLQFDRTFQYMTGRRLQRRYRGVYKQYSFAECVFTWVVVLYTLVVFAASAFGYSLNPSDHDMDLSDAIFFTMLVFIVVYIIVQVAMVIRWMVYWALCGATIGYILLGSLESVFWVNSERLTASDRNVRYILTILLIVVELLTIAGYIFTHFAFPWLVFSGKIDTIWWWTVKRSDRHANTLTYRSRALFFSRKRHTATYTGGLDEDGRPHGYGMWNDTSFHGERLTGQWEHGLPIGPYRSFEHGSGYCFVKVRVGYCHNRAEERPDQIRFFPRHSSEGLHWGVTSVECSVSGGFFKFLPSVNHLTPIDGSSEAPQSAADCVRLLQSPVDSVVYRKIPSKGHLMSKRSRSGSRLSFWEAANPVIESTVGADHAEREALVLLHGFNCSLDYAVNRLAQLLTLGDFPPSIHPFVFSWPSGSALAYVPARSVGTESEQTAQGFRAFLQGLVDAGYTTIHLIAHSMGARVYFHTLDLGYLDDVFEMINADPEQREDQGPESKRARLATLTFANADYDLKDFVKFGGAYDLSRRFCDMITLYADGMDGALFFSEIFTKQDVLGPCNYSIGRRAHMIHRDPNEVTDTEDSPLADHRHTVEFAIADVNQRGGFDGVKAFAYNHRLRDLSTTSTIDEEESPKYLDMDVIDTTWMDNNVHSMRHNYFNLNPTVVDDIRNLIVSRRRAASRRGLLQAMPSENVYIFLVAPSHVKNK
ncbi:hypothetical protein Poli38472_009530 [Pythium oligandrum]|uniref:Uncharacterized protein n=1 Tax=Pythium oligandrum TaxID=41045 RepID=A0A8K1CH42_PYTOL|nr:hypothetical protein Poli38472_009530 [Pythium oligandrum]|eukprot:TMW62037.1 hypothetical protein Poli38472_009530 [Pythium oligandrum]